jgi:hypothetical protein
LKIEEPLRLECQHFLECVRQRKQPLSDGRDGLRVLEVLEAAQQSLRNNGVPIPIERNLRPTKVADLVSHESIAKNGMAISEELRADSGVPHQDRKVS